MNFVRMQFYFFSERKFIHWNSRTFKSMESEWNSM